jgi:hypothetical protein
MVPHARGKVVMNIFKMLEMYLQEHGIRCHIPKNLTYKGVNNPDDKIKIHLKHVDLGDEITLSVSQVELTVKGTKVYGNTTARRHQYDKPEAIEIADLSDPQAFERIRLWIRQKETTMRHSVEAQNALGRLMNSPYAQQVKFLEGEFEEDLAALEVDGDKISALIEDLKPTVPLTISNSSSILIRTKGGSQIVELVETQKDPTLEQDEKTADRTDPASHNQPL